MALALLTVSVWETNRLSNYKTSLKEDDDDDDDDGEEGSNAADQGDEERYKRNVKAEGDERDEDGVVPTPS